MTISDIPGENSAIRRDIAGGCEGLSEASPQRSSASALAFAEIYPRSPGERDQWILSHRSVRNSVTAQRAYAFLLEKERSETGERKQVATIFLTNRECPWRCLMCDLWKNTLPETPPIGAIPDQIDRAFAELETTERAGEFRATTWVKLYNSGSFFDRHAIPFDDYAAIAGRISSFQRVVVESHPALITESVVHFRDLLAGKLEIAMGLETADPSVLDQLNKRMTLEQFGRAAAFLHVHGIDLRTFVLVKPPFVNETDAIEWAQRSIDFAFSCGARVVSLIPVRFGNGALESLARLGLFSPPKLTTLEMAAAYGVGLRRGTVLVDLWDVEQLAACKRCFSRRLARLEQMNDLQIVPLAVQCQSCDGK